MVQLRRWMAASTLRRWAASSQPRRSGAMARPSSLMRDSSWKSIGPAAGIDEHQRGAMSLDVDRRSPPVCCAWCARPRQVRSAVSFQDRAPRRRRDQVGRPAPARCRWTRVELVGAPRRWRSCWIVIRDGAMRWRREPQREQVAAFDVTSACNSSSTRSSVANRGRRRRAQQCDLLGRGEQDVGPG